MPSRTILLAVAAATASSLVAQTWTNVSPAAAPTIRRAGAMAFDSVGNRLIAYGGNAPSPGTILDETWSYNGFWTLLTPTQPAPGRWGHQLVRDTVRNRLVTFGGRSPTVSGLANDTWIWTGSTWSALVTPASPTRRFHYGMCYDSARDRVVLFGGRSIFASVGDTWEFDGTTWTERPFTNAPSKREEMVMAFDASRRQTVLFGGIDGDTNTLLGDTWEYDGTAWQPIAPASSPTPRYRCAYAYDTTRQRLVVYGGYDGVQIRTQTFEYTGETWESITVGAGSTNATEMYAGFDPVRNRFVTFGGVGALFSNQTHEYQGVGTAQFAQFGQGCPTSAGVATISAVTPPRLGTTFTMEFANLPLASSFLFTAQGFSATTWNSNALPFNLSAVGLSGCLLDVSADVLLGLGVTGGTATFGFTIPNTPSLTNLAYYVQAYVPDAGAPNDQGGLSRAGRALFGS